MLLLLMLLAMSPYDGNNAAPMGLQPLCNQPQRCNNNQRHPAINAMHSLGATNNATLPINVANTADGSVQCSWTSRCWKFTIPQAGTPCDLWHKSHSVLLMTKILKFAMSFANDDNGQTPFNATRSHSNLSLQHQSNHHNGDACSVHSLELWV